VAFASGSDNLVPDDTNTSWDIFVHDHVTDQTSRVSVASDGAQANQGSYWPSISSDGRYVAFQSNASDLVPDDFNGARDVFVHDRVMGTTVCVSRASDGTQGTNISYQPIISADGRYVAFLSLASELVGGDTNGVADAYVHDRVTGQTERVSVASDGTQANGETGVTSISADGRYVTFVSTATNLVPVDMNDAQDIFVHDRVVGETIRVSVASSGAEAQGDSDWRAISADGRYVAFQSDAANLVSGDTNENRDVFVRDRLQGEAIQAAVIPSAGESMTSWDFGTILDFPPNTFTDAVTVTYTSYFPERHPLPSNLVDIGEFFDLSGVYSDTGIPANPAQAYTITVKYADPKTDSAVENTLALYYWDGDEWVREASSSVNSAERTVAATPQHFSSWAVLGETMRVYLPLILRSY
jgi:Tol biopolymer transport system component